MGEETFHSVARIRRASLMMTVFLALLGPAGEIRSEEPASATLFVHVNVVPMNNEQVLRDQSVLVEGGTIKAIAPELAASKDVRVIDGRGTEFLSPGLADMHTHSDTSRDMAVFLANGVTTVLNMGDASSGFIAQTRPAVNRGEKPGPHIYAAFLLDGSPQYGHLVVANPAEARAMVDVAKTNGYDFIKVYNNLSPECFQALVEQGRAAGLPVVGHGVTRVGIERQLAAGQLMVAHAEEYFYTVFFPPGSDPGNRAPDIAQMKSAIDFTRRAGAFVTADLNTYATIAQQWGKPAVLQAFSPSARSPLSRSGRSRALEFEPLHPSKRQPGGASGVPEEIQQSAVRCGRAAHYRDRQSIHPWSGAGIFSPPGFGCVGSGRIEPLSGLERCDAHAGRVDRESKASRSEIWDCGNRPAC